MVLVMCPQLGRGRLFTRQGFEQRTIRETTPNTCMCAMSNANAALGLLRFLSIARAAT